MTAWILVGSVLGIPLIYFLGKNLKGWYTLCINIVIAVSSTVLILPALAGDIQFIDLAYLNVLGPLRIEIDSLSAFFILIINLVVITSAIYSLGYLKIHNHSYSPDVHYSAFIFLHLSMVMVCMVQQLFLFFVIWEVMSLSSFLLVLYESDQRGNLKAAMNYFVQMHIGVVMLMLAFIWLNFKTGGDNFAALHIFFGVNPNFALFALFFMGFGMKAGFVPLHTWAPYADVVAPSHIAGLMSGVMTKLGIYGILRVLTFVQADFLQIGLFVVFISLTTGVYGILQSTVQKDIKKMLAYCSVENIGIIGIGLGLGILGKALNNSLIAQIGFAGCMLHILNHALMKPLLFYGAGSVYFSAHTRKIDLLGGLIKRMPFSAVLFLCASAAMCGLPPFNGFISEFLIYNGMLGLLQADFSMDVIELALLLGFILIGGLAVFSFTRLAGTVYLGNPRSELAANAKEVPFLMLAPQFFLLAFMLFIGLSPELFVKQISLLSMPLMEGMLIEDLPIGPIHSVGVASLLFLVMVIVVFLIRTYFVRKNGERYEPTWSGGYTGNTSRMQYTAASFGNNLLQLLRPLIGQKIKFREIDKSDIFPADRPLNTQEEDLIEHRGIHPPLEYISAWMVRFARVQDGNTQHYIMYVFVFIIVITLLTVFNLI